MIEADRAAIGTGRRADWFRRDRVIAWSLALVIVQLLLLGYVVLRAHGAFGPPQLPFAIDFLSFYSAGSLVLQGTPALAYDQAAHWHAQQMLGGADVTYNYFFYPPPFLLVCGALASLPYMTAFVLFEAITLAAYLVIVRRISTVDGWGWYAPALAFPPVYWCLGLGQNAFLSAALFGIGTIFIDTRPLRAGTALGMLCWKPHFGLLIPAALAAGGHWRAFTAATATVASLIVATTLLFGIETWQAYLHLVANSGAVYGTGKVLFAGYVTIFGAARLIGLPVTAAILLQGAASLFAVALVVRIWRARASLPLRAASLIAGTLLSVPVALIYDLVLLGVSSAWLVSAGLRQGWRPDDRPLLMLVYAIALISFAVGTLFSIPVGPLAPAIILAICLRHQKV